MENIEGWLTAEEGDFLAEESVNKICLEIGSHKGKSSSYIAKQAKKLICIDPFYIRTNDQWQFDGRASVYLDFLSNTAPYRNITIIRGLSKECADFFVLNYFDMIFIDGAHTYENVASDIESWLPKIKKNGVLMFHDYTTYPAVKKAFDQYFGIPEKIIDSIAKITKR